MELIASYERKLKRKVIYRYAKPDVFPPGNLHWIASGWHRFFAIDTNTRIIDGVKVSVASVIQGRVLATEQGIGSYQFDTYYSEAYANVEGNPESYAICQLVRRVERDFPNASALSFGIITDSELSHIDEYNAQTRDLLPGFKLPENFHMMYATDGAGRDAYIPNKMIAMCDQVSSEALKTAKVNIRIS